MANSVESDFLGENVGIPVIHLSQSLRLYHALYHALSMVQAGVQQAWYNHVYLNKKDR